MIQIVDVLEELLVAPAEVLATGGRVSVAAVSELGPFAVPVAIVATVTFGWAISLRWSR